ncbi:hypothetical protein L596_015683 [Steinernema carpocapsae]|uniref:Uncharacterized protein n=1 Tax=Steinernema carpocapsae TaxID=34508 RepID=A0A4U5NGP2_STECR|nr:hypothetical protein L596_015683 [Steinernema carpocapsae]
MLLTRPLLSVFLLIPGIWAILCYNSMTRTYSECPTIFCRVSGRDEFLSSACDWHGFCEHETVNQNGCCNLKVDEVVQPTFFNCCCDEDYCNACWSVDNCFEKLGNITKKRI